MAESRERAADYPYDVCLSFAGEQREYVAQVAATLERGGVRVFYDGYEQVNLWGKNLYEHFDRIYRTEARYCVLFASREYAERVWTNHERRSAQARALEESREYVLPARFDDTEIPGLLPTVSYVDLRQLLPQEVAQLLLEKLGVGDPEPAERKELRRGCRQLSQALHRFLTERNRQDPSRRDIFGARRAEASEEERQRAWQEHANEIIRFSIETMDVYRERFMVPTLSLYDECVRQDIELDISRSRFEHPTNPFGIADVANALGAVGAYAV